MKKQKHNVSFVIAIYNPNLNKLKDTIESIVKQKGINSEIVICDDGSKTDYSGFLSELFFRINYCDYSYIRQKENVGTVKNVFAGVMACTSKYIKLLSPGDYMYSENIISEWLGFLKKNKADWSFGEAVYYRTENNHKFVFSGIAYPLDIKPYIKKDVKKCQWNCCVLKDLILGANTLCKKTILAEYLAEIVGKVRYAEDNIYRLMIFDGNIGVYFPKKTIFYEYGEGISTVKSTHWEKALHEDFINSNIIMKSHNSQKDPWKQRILNSFERWYFRKGYARLFNLLLLRNGFRMFYYRKYCPRKTQM